MKDEVHFMDEMHFMASTVTRWQVSRQGREGAEARQVRATIEKKL